jgi:hypothetical protein
LYRFQQGENEFIKEVNDLTIATDHEVDVLGLGLNPSESYFIEGNLARPECQRNFRKDFISNKQCQDVEISVVSSSVDFLTVTSSEFVTIDYKIKNLSTQKIISISSIAVPKKAKIQTPKISPDAAYEIELNLSTNRPWCPKIAKTLKFKFDENIEPEIIDNWECDDNLVNDEENYQIISLLDGGKGVVFDDKYGRATNLPNTSFVNGWDLACDAEGWQRYETDFDSAVAINTFYATTYDLSAYKGRIVCAAIKVKAIGLLEDQTSSDAWTDSMISYIRPYTYPFKAHDFTEFFEKKHITFASKDYAQLALSSKQFNSNRGAWIEKTKNTKKKFVGIKDYAKFKVNGEDKNFVELLSKVGALHFIFQDDSSVDFFELVLLVKKNK